jgi:hypothetical protein
LTSPKQSEFDALFDFARQIADAAALSGRVISERFLLPGYFFPFVIESHDRIRRSRDLVSRGPGKTTNENRLEFLPIQHSVLHRVSNRFSRMSVSFERIEQGRCLRFCRILGKEELGNWEIW